MRRGAPVPRRSPWCGPAIAIALGMVLGFGCTNPSASDPGADLRASARTYMELRQQGRWEEVWSRFLIPQQREAVERAAFVERRRLAFDIHAFEIESVEVEEDAGTVVVQIDAVISVLEPGGGTRRIPRAVTNRQAWVREGGRWYVELEE